MSKSQLGNLGKELNEALSAYTASNSGDAQARQQLLSAAEQIISEVRSPMEKAYEFCHTITEVAMILQLIDMKVLEHIPAAGVVSLSSIAEKAGVEEDLLLRFIRVLVARGALTLNESGEVSATELLEPYKNPIIQAIYLFMCRDVGVALLSLDRFFAKHGYKSPPDPLTTPWGFSIGKEGEPYWDVLSKDEARLTSFHRVMSSINQILAFKKIFDFSWIREHANDVDKDKALVVDIGGSKGQDLVEILGDCPDLDKTRLVLQDLPDVIEEYKDEVGQKLPGVVGMKHDFFNPQPVKGALLYYLRRVLHDWSDENSRIILSHIADAMGPSSRLLITENVMADPPNTTSVFTDMIMMTMSGRERTAKDWTRLVESSGLKIVKIWRADGIELGVIECCKA